MATIQHSAWELLSSCNSLAAQRAKGKEDPAPHQLPVPPSSLQKKTWNIYPIFFSGHAKPSLSISVWSSKLEGSTGVEITSSRDAEGKRSFSWGSLLLNFQIGRICRIQHFLRHSPGKLLKHNWASLIECSSKWPFKSLFSTPNFHFSWSFTTIL